MLHAIERTWCFDLNFASILLDRWEPDLIFSELGIFISVALYQFLYRVDTLLIYFVAGQSCDAFSFIIIFKEQYNVLFYGNHSHRKQAMLNIFQASAAQYQRLAANALSVSSSTRRTLLIDGRRSMRNHLPDLMVDAGLIFGCELAPKHYLVMWMILRPTLRYWASGFKPMSIYFYYIIPNWLVTSNPQAFSACFNYTTQQYSLHFHEARSYS